MVTRKILLFATLAVTIGVAAFTMMMPASRGEGTVAAKFKAILEEFKELEQKTQASFESAKEAEKPEMVKTYLANRMTLAKKALELAKADSKDPQSIEPTMFAMVIGKRDKEVVADAQELLATQHADSTELLDVLMRMGGDLNNRAFIEKIIKNSKTPIVQATGYLSLAQAIGAASEDIAESDPAKSKALRLEALAMVKKVGTDFADAKLKEYSPAAESKNLEFALENLAIGMTVPDTESTSLDGKKVKPSDYRGKVLVLDFWATWCGPCVAMLPHSRQMVARLRGKPFAMVSISADDDVDEVKTFAKQNDMVWSQWHEGPNGAMKSKWNINSLPSIFVIDAKGVIRHKGLREDDLEDAVKKLIKEAEAETK